MTLRVTGRFARRAALLTVLGGAAFGVRRATADDPATSDIQATLNRQATARARGDRDAFMATIDQRNLTWRRIQGDAFTLESGRGQRAALSYWVTGTQAKQSGYVKAWIDIGAQDGAALVVQAVWVFRQAESGWLHSEILNEEIGPRKSQSSEHFTLGHFDWDDDVIERMVGVAERAHAHVTVRTGIVPAGRPAISVNPTYGAHSALRGYGTWALFLPNTDQIVIRSIESYGAGITAPGETQEDRLLVALTHEYAHLVNNSVVPTVKMPKWMVEGFAEFVTSHLREGSMAQALRNGRTITLDRASEIIEWGEDPSRGFTRFDVDLAYAHAAHATAYVMERFGQERFLALASEFAESRRWEESVVKTLAISAPDLDGDWLGWVRARYGF